MKFTSILFGLGRGLRYGLIAIGGLALLGGAVAWADYTLSQGVGTTFASLVIAGRHYAAYLLCDTTVGETQCAAVDANNSLQTRVFQGAVPLSATNGLYANVLQGNAALSATNGMYSNLLQGNAALSATNGIYSNLLVGNAAISTANGLPSTIVQAGNAAAVKAGNLGATTDLALGVYDANTLAAIAGATPSGTNTIGYTSDDPCTKGTNKTTAAISQTGSAAIITGASTRKTYICGGSINLVDAESISIVEGTTNSTPCDTGAFALMGSTTVANGMPLAANEGLSMGSGGATNILAGHTLADNVCILQSGSGRLAGWVTYVQAP